MAYTTLKLEREGAIATITLDRPEKRNAISAEMLSDLHAALDAVEASPARVAIIRGSGKAFCAGMDLKAFAAGGPPKGMGEFFEQGARKPLIAAIEGYAVAGGFELLLGCDLVVASTNASFGIPEVKRSLVAAGGGLFRLGRKIPFNIAMELALTGDPIGAEVAHHHGLVNRVCQPGQALAAATAQKDTQLAAFIAECRHLGTSEAAIEAAEKRGYDTGLKIPHPLMAGRNLPLYVANFVLMEYGAGALYGDRNHAPEGIEGLAGNAADDAETADRAHANTQRNKRDATRRVAAGFAARTHRLQFVGGNQAVGARVRVVNLLAYGEQNGGRGQ